MLFDKVYEAKSFIEGRIESSPLIGIILGTGLYSLLDEVEDSIEISYSDIPHFPNPTVVTHKASMIIGKYHGLTIIVMLGRFHHYEGYDMEAVTFGVRVLAMLGIGNLLITNITGGINPSYNIGDIVVVKDHINLQSANPLRGVDDQRLGPRFPSMVNAYDQQLRKIAKSVSISKNIETHEGIYVSVNGPSLETPAEYRFLHMIGADMVGMSTVAEVIVARQHGLKTLVLSVISNKCLPVEELEEDTIETILANVEKEVPRMKKLLKGIIEQLL